MSNPFSRRKAAAAFILVTVCLDMLSIGIIIPVLPQLVMKFTNGSVSTAGMWIGIFGAAWGLAQFVFSPLQGALSDSIGRRPVILASNLGTGLDYLLMAMAPGLWWLLAARIISGCTAASVSTAYAYMSDVTAPEGRARVFGLMGAAFGVGFVVGPSLGGLLGDINEHLPFYVAAGLSLLNFCYGFFVLPESLPKEKRRRFEVHAANPVGAMRFLSRTGQTLRLASMNLLMMFAHSVFPTTFVLYAGYRFAWGPKEVGLCLGAVGIMSAVVQAGLTGVFVKAFGEMKTLYIGLICGLISFAGYALAPGWEIFVAFMPFGALWGLTTPNIQSLLSRHVDPKEQGTLQGSNMSLSATATIFAPLIFGWVLSFVTHPQVPRLFSGASFLLAGGFVLLGLLLALGVRSHTEPAKPLSS